MPAALTPELALDYLRELSADVLAGAVLDGGRLLAGPRSLADPAAAVVAALGPAREGAARLGSGAVFAARRGSLAVVLACGPYAVAELARHDLGLVLSDLGAAGASAPAGEVAVLPRPIAEALLSAARGEARE